MIKFEKINKVFKGDFWTKPFKALDDVSFEISSGDIVGFLGANGAGKTTSIKILMDYIHPTSGTVTFDTQLGVKRKDILKRIGYLPERPYFYPDLTAREFLNYIGRLNDLKSVQINEEIKNWTALLSIEFALDRKLNFFSKGMLQRLGFASALINNPDLLILDEPLAGLDPVGRREFKDVILKLSKQGKTIFFSSHIIHDVEEVSNEVIILEDGKLIYSGGVKKLLEDNSDEDFELSLVGEVKLDENIFSHFGSPDNNSLYIIKKDDINSALSYLSENKIDILKLSQRIPSLEKIVYEADK